MGRCCCPKRSEVLMTPEPFVSAEEAARFLSVKRRYLLALARRGLAGAYALGTGTIRKVWVFRLSELAIAVEEQSHLIPRTQKYDTIRSDQATSTLERGLHELSAWIDKNIAPQGRRHLGVTLPRHSAGREQNGENRAHRPCS